MLWKLNQEALSIELFLVNSLTEQIDEELIFVLIFGPSSKLWKGDVERG